MEQVNETYSTIKKSRHPGKIHVLKTFTPEDAEAVIARIRMVAAEIVAERDAELVAVVSAAIDQSRAASWSGTSREAIAAIRAAGYTITKAGAAS